MSVCFPGDESPRTASRVTLPEGRVSKTNGLFRPTAVQGRGRAIGDRTLQKNAAGLPRRSSSKNYSAYFDTDFLNMRSIFSLIASMAVEFDCAVDNA